jgi:outer membrane protein OmpA-like peptidoglycan-associated protein
MKKYIQLFLCLLIITTAGCGKKKNNMPENNKPLVKKSQSSLHKVTAFDENLQAFALDDDTLHNFAHDKKVVETSSTQSSQAPHVIFQWQDAAVDQSKEDFKTIYFEFDKDKINKEQESNLQADIDHAKKMIKLGKVIVVEGHACDSAGSAIYNLALSERRAKFIALQFTQAGIEKMNIKIAARGQEMPVHKGGNRHEQAVNRRVEVYAIDSK